jgi:sulfide dehydrogenase cytochrome subunit
MGCHGPGGVSSGPSIPTLAGMSAGYLLEAMEHFGNGERHATIMHRIVAGYGSEQLQMIAGYFAAQPFQAAAQEFDPDRANRGADLHLNSCDLCHSDSGRNPADDKGLLAGQWMEYLRNTLDDFRAGRSEGPDTMIDRIKMMSSEDLEDLVHYYGSFMTDNAAPEAPQNLTVTEVTTTTVTLSWMPPVDNADVAAYQVFRDDQLAGETDMTTFIFTDEELTPATSYVYTVVAIDGAGNA